MASSLALTVASGASVQVNVRDGGAATVYAAESGGTTLSNPLTADAMGRIEGWLEEGSYDLVVSGSEFTTYTQRFEAVAGRVSSAQTLATDAAFTLTPRVSPEQTFHTGTLTADRAVTLSTTGASTGAKFRITRTGGGAFNLNVGTGPLKALATNTWGEFMYDGAAWKLAAYGAL